MKVNILRISGILVLALVVWIGIGFAGAQRACAHDPRFVCSPRAASDPVPIEMPTKSWAFYGHLRSGQVDTYVTTLDRAEKMSWSLLIDTRDAGNSARPAATVTRPDGKTVQRLDFSDSQEFYEPFSREHYLTTRTRVLSLAPGTYRIQVAMHGGNNMQRYTMALGDQERFGVADIPFVFGAIHRIRALDY